MHNGSLSLFGKADLDLPLGHVGQNCLELVLALYHLAALGQVTMQVDGVELRTWWCKRRSRCTCWGPLHWRRSPGSGRSGPYLRFGQRQVGIPERTMRVDVLIYFRSGLLAGRIGRPSPMGRLPSSSSKHSTPVAADGHAGVGLHKAVDGYRALLAGGNGVNLGKARARRRRRRPQTHPAGRSGRSQGRPQRPGRGPALRLHRPADRPIRCTGQCSAPHCRRAG